MSESSHSSSTYGSQGIAIVTAITILLLLPSDNIDNSYMIVEHNYSESFANYKQKEDAKLQQIEQTRKAMLSKMKTKQNRTIKKRQYLTKLSKQNKTK